MFFEHYPRRSTAFAETRDPLWDVGQVYIREDEPVLTLNTAAILPVQLRGDWLFCDGSPVFHKAKPCPLDSLNVNPMLTAL
jgi:hypothetical protein